MSSKIKRTHFGLIGRKVGMTQMFKDDGDVIPVTVLEVGPCTVTQVKTPATDGYYAVQLGFADKKKNRVLKTEAGHFAKAKTPAKRFVQEIRLDEKTIQGYELGQVLTADLFKAGDKVDVTGTSIGKGYAGVMKRWNFAGFPMSHGTHEFRRHGGSIGNRSDPGKVFKNKKMAGHLGNERVTTQNLQVVAIEAENNYVLVRGAVPGAKNGYIMISASAKGGFDARSPKAAGGESSEATAQA